MKLLVGALLAGAVLKIFMPNTHSLLSFLAAGAFATYLLQLIGPRSHVERVGLVLLVALAAWVGGPAVGRGSLLLYLLAWTTAGSALAWHLTPK